MRLDKYLKVTRLIKRRTIAKEVIDQDVVYVNDRIAKPSKEIQEGDIIRLILGKKRTDHSSNEFTSYGFKKRYQRNV